MYGYPSPPSGFFKGCSVLCMLRGCYAVQIIRLEKRMNKQVNESLSSKWRERILCVALVVIALVVVSLVAIVLITIALVIVALITVALIVVVLVVVVLVHLVEVCCTPIIVLVHHLCCSIAWLRIPDNHAILNHVVCSNRLHASNIVCIAGHRIV